MANSFNKIVLAGSLANTPGAYYEPVTVSSIGAGNATAMLNSQAIPAGVYVLLPTANVTIEFNAYTGTANSWTTWIAANAGATISSDGTNVRANATTGTQTLTLYTVNGGQAVSGTYNAS